MRSVSVASLGLALVMTSIGVISSAQGQSAPPVHNPNITVDPNALSGTGAIIGKGDTRAVTIKKGWNDIHAYNCVVTLDGKKEALTLYSTKDEAVSITSPYPLHQTMMLAQCTNGNWVSFYVTKLLSGGKFNWSSLQSWDYK